MFFLKSDKHKSVVYLLSYFYVNKLRLILRLQKIAR